MEKLSSISRGKCQKNHETDGLMETWGPRVEKREKQTPKSPEPKVKEYFIADNKKNTWNIARQVAKDAAKKMS